jgi:hypothetical protein
MQQRSAGRTAVGAVVVGRLVLRFMRVTQTRREIQMLDQRIGLVGEEGEALLGLLLGVRLPGDAGDERVSG